MSEPFFAEIRIFAGNFAPRSWAFCDGQLLPIAQNTALFSVIGTTYGGDGRTTTALPDLQGRAPMHPGRGPGLTSRRLGEKLGTDRVSLNELQIPSHTHALRGDSSSAKTDTPNNEAALARPRGASGTAFHSNASENLAEMSYETVATTGGGQAHANLQPYLALNFIIALLGIYPSRS